MCTVKSCAGITLDLGVVSSRCRPIGSTPCPASVKLGSKLGTVHEVANFICTQGSPIGETKGAFYCDGASKQDAKAR